MVFGTGKNGKSTMLNALLGDDLLPSGTTTCTGNSTEIGPVRNAAGKEIVRLHRAGDPPDKWEEHALQPPGSSPRMKPEWVVDMTIDEIKIEHKHEIFRHNVKILDVPGCVTSPASYESSTLQCRELNVLALLIRLNQDSVRSVTATEAMQRSDILLVVCSAKSATGSLTLEEKNMLKEWQDAWYDRWKAKPVEQVIVVCNKMNAIGVSPAPIPRHEALQLIVDNSKRFQSKRMQKKSNAEKLEEAAEDYEDATDAELDQEARPYKKPDEGPTRRKVQEDVLGTVLRFTEPGLLGLQIDVPFKPGERQVRVKSIAPETHVQFPELRKGMVIRQIGDAEVPMLPIQAEACAETKEAHEDHVLQMCRSTERPLDIRFDGLFPKTKEGSIHFVSANEALTATLNKTEEPEVFQSMRNSLFKRLKE